MISIDDIANSHNAGHPHTNLVWSLKAKQPGSVLEFGVFHGDSLRVLAKNVADTVHGFDSFEGLPEDWTWRPNDPGHHRKGYFAAPDWRNFRFPENSRIWPGLFEDTVPQWLAEVAGDISFIHIDSDLYSSARTILFGLNERIVPGTVLVFDEIYAGWENVEDKFTNWAAHEWRALQEWMDEKGRDVAPYSRSNRYAATVVVTR